MKVPKRLTPSLDGAVLQKLAGPQLVKKLPASYGTRRFVTAFTRALHSVPTLSQINPVHAPLNPFL